MAELTNQHLLAHGGSDTFFRRQNALEIERIRRCDCNWLARALSPEMAKHLHSAGKRKLLARKACHESPAADFPAKLHPPINASQCRPVHRKLFPRQGAPEDDACSAEQLSRRQLV